MVYSLTHLFNAGRILYCWKYCNLFTNVIFKSFFGYSLCYVHNEAVRAACVDRRQCVARILSYVQYPVIAPHSYRKLRPIWASSETSSLQHLKCAKYREISATGQILAQSTGTYSLTAWNFARLEVPVWTISQAVGRTGCERVHPTVVRCC